MKTHKQLAVEALEKMAWNHLGPLNHYWAIFEKYSPTEMQEIHGGDGGLTRAQVLAEAEELMAKFNEAIEWVKNAK